MKNKNKLNTAKLSIFLSGIIFALNLVSADFGDETCVGLGMMSGWGYGLSSPFGFIFWILVLVALVLLIAWLIKQLQNSKGGKRK
jgi:hypothetical protein